MLGRWFEAGLRNTQFKKEVHGEKNKSGNTHGDKAPSFLKSDYQTAKTGGGGEM